MVGSGIPFVRVQSCGNDFLLIDNRDDLVSTREATLARAVCRRGISEGADGLLLAERPSGTAHVRMRLINPDGSEGEMCGNGALAFSRLTSERLDVGTEFVIETLGGPVSASVDHDVVHLTLRSLSSHVDRMAVALDGHDVDVRYLEVYGVPHAVVLTSTQAVTDEIVGRHGRLLRHHPSFARGANVNFASVLNSSLLEVRTFERGVDAETLSCGTGSIASALALREVGGLTDEIQVRTRGGSLQIRSSGMDGRWDVQLEGHPRIVSEGVLLDEAWAQ
jgi:diaminopimelate epimerase